MTAHAAIKNTFFEDFFVQKSLTIIYAGKVGIGELSPLIRVEDLGFAVFRQSLAQNIAAEPAVKCGRNPPRQNIAAVPVYYRSQIDKSAIHFYISDIRAPYLIDMRYRNIPQ